MPVLQGMLKNALLAPAADHRARAVQHGDVVAGHTHRPPVDAAQTADLPIARCRGRHFGALGAREGADLDETPRIEQPVDTLPDSQAALGMHTLDAVHAAHVVPNTLALLA
jgi:hypothetical protein